MNKNRKILILAVNILFIINILIAGNKDVQLLILVLALGLLFNVCFFAPEIGKLVDRTEKKIIDYAYIKENYDLYRNIINDYSIGELALIDDYDFSYPKDLIAVLLKLELNKKIRLEEDEIVVLDKENLKKSEKYILDHIANGKVVLKRDRDLKKIFESEGFDDELLERKEQLSISEVVFFIVSFIAIMTYGFIAGDNKYTGIVVFGGFCMLFVFFMVVLMGKAMASSSSWKLSKKGQDLNLKLNGLKNLINDFSNMNERDKNELVLWEDYLIYSVIFGNNKNIVDKYKKLVVIEQYDI